VDVQKKLGREGSSLVPLTASARPNFGHCSFPGGFAHFPDIAGIILSMYSSLGNMLKGPDRRSREVDRAFGFRAG
jgi:hypothetical protein